MATPLHSLDTISKLLDLSPRRVQQLSKEGVIPKESHGKYELVSAVRGYINYLKERTLNPNVISFDEVKAKKAAAEAELTIIELEEKKKELVRTEEVIESWLDIISSCKSKMLSLPAKLAPITAVENNPAICKSIIEQQIYEALDELSEQILSGLGIEEDGGSSMEAPPENDSEPMG